MYHIFLNSQHTLYFVFLFAVFLHIKLNEKCVPINNKRYIFFLIKLCRSNDRIINVERIYKSNDICII